MSSDEKKVVEFPDTGKMWTRYSKNLAKSLCDYLASQGDEWDPLELNRYGIIRLPCTLENKIDILQNIHIERTRYVCETIVTVSFAEEERPSIEHYARTVDTLNATLVQGAFLLDKDSGGVVFLTMFEPDEQATAEQLAKFVEYPKKMISKFGRLFFANEK